MLAARPVLLTLALALGACGPTVTLTDDIDVTWDFGPTLQRFKNDLHTPYVKGTKVMLYVDSDEDDQDFTGWSVVSSDPSIFKVGTSSFNGTSLVVDGTALGEGVANLTVRDDENHVVGHGDAEVLVPDRVELEAHGYLILGRDDEAAISEARIIENGRATYLVRYFRGDRQLGGNNVLTVVTPDGITATPRTSYLFENREWLTLDTTVPGQQTIEIVVGGVSIGTRSVVTVAETEIADVVVLTQSEDGVKDGDWLVALAQAYDSAGQRIFGIDYEWDVDGLMQISDGDLYRYEFARGMYQMVTANTVGHSDSVMIQSEEGFVDSSNRVGCSAGTSNTSALVILGLGLGFVVVSRRRRPRR